MKTKRTTFDILNDEGLFSHTLNFHLYHLVKGENHDAIKQSANLLEKLAMGSTTADSEQAFVLWQKYFLSNN
jgi:hypothetical protein